MIGGEIWRRHADIVEPRMLLVCELGNACGLDFRLYFDDFLLYVDDFRLFFNDFRLFFNDFGYFLGCLLLIIVLGVILVAFY